MRLLTTPITLDDIEAMARAGADGLLFGCSAVSYRHVSEFPYDGWKEIVKRCHKNGVEALFLMNRLFCEEELAMMKEILGMLLEVGADGIYFADEALLAYAMTIHQEARMIYQPDTLLTNHLDVNYYLEEGCRQVVLSKEITLSEIMQIANHCDADKLELIGHGRVVMMHSKRPLLSNYMEFMKRNVVVKGKRDFYIIEDTRNDAMPIIEDDAGTHIFSSYILNSFREMETFMEAGIGAMRIDGILQTREETMETLRLYHKIRKGILDGKQAEAIYQERFPKNNIGSGFYYQATSTTK